MIFWILYIEFSCIEWYFKLSLRVPLSHTEISLNGPMVPNDTEWYSMVINGIPLALFYKGIVTCQVDASDCGSI